MYEQTAFVPAWFPQIDTSKMFARFLPRMYNEYLNNPDQLFNLTIIFYSQEPGGNHQYNLKKGVGVPVELKMAPGLKVGNRVKANATFIFSYRRARDIFGPWASRHEVHGTVVEVLGSFPLLSFCAHALL